MRSDRKKLNAPPGHHDRHALVDPTAKHPQHNRQDINMPTKSEATAAYLEASPTVMPKPKLLAWVKDGSRSADELIAASGIHAEVDRAIASHGRAPAELLSTLSHSSDRATRARVAANPSTPTADIVRLGQQFPKEFLANPALDLLMLENPALLQDAPTALLMRLLRNDRCPPEFLIWAAGLADEKLQLAVAMQAAAPDLALHRLRESAHASVREAVQARADISDSVAPSDPEAQFRQAVKDRLAKLTCREALDAWKAGDIGLAQWPYLPRTIRLELARVEVSGLVLCKQLPLNWIEELATEAATTAIDSLPLIARDPSAPVSVLQSWVDHPDWCVRARVLEAVAENRAIPAALLMSLAKHKDLKIRLKVARNPGTPAEVLTALSKDKDVYLRSVVASNAITPVAVLEVLATDKWPVVLSSTAANPSTPMALRHHLLKALANVSGFRDAVASDPATPVDVLEALARDKKAHVRQAVAANPATPMHVRQPLMQAWLKKAGDHKRQSIAANVTTPAVVLEALAEDRSTVVRWEVAENPTTPLAVLEALAKDKVENVRVGVANNPAAPAALLEALATDGHLDVRRKAAKNASTPRAMLEVLASEADSRLRLNVAQNPVTPVAAAGAMLEALARDKDEDIRWAIACDPQCPAAVLVTLSKDKSTRMRQVIATNPGASVAMLLSLARDANPHVRKAVAENAAATAEMLQALARDANPQVRKAVAENAAATAEVLQALAHDAQDEPVLAALLHNPSTGPDLAHAVANLLLAGDPRKSAWYRLQLSKAPPEILHAAKNDDVLHFCGEDPNKSVLAKRALAPLMALGAGPYVEPSRIVQVVGSTDWMVRAAVARNRGTPPNLLKKLASDIHPMVAALAAANLRGASRVASGLPAAGFAVTTRPAMRLDRAVSEIGRRLREKALWSCMLHDPAWSDQATVADVWQVLPELAIGEVHSALDQGQRNLMWTLGAALPHDGVRLKLAMHPACPPQLLELFAADRSPAMLVAVARHPAWPNAKRPSLIKKITRLRGDKLTDVARNHMTPPDVLQALAGTTSPTAVRYWIAANPSTPSETLKELVKSKDLREAVAKNSAAPASLLKALAKYRNKAVLMALAGNGATPGSVRQQLLEAMTADADPEARHLAASAPETPLALLAELAIDRTTLVRSGVAANPRAPHALLEALATDEQVVIRAVASNPSASPALLERMAGTLCTLTRRNIAANPSASAALLEQLSKDSDAAVRLAAVLNPDAAPAAANGYVTGWVNCMRRALDREACGHGNTPTSASHDLQPDDLQRALGWLGCIGADADNKALTKASHSMDWFSRLTVALHPKASNAQLDLLAWDAEADVAAVAKWRLARVAESVK